MGSNFVWIPALPDNDQPRYLALVEAIASAIEQGELKAGERLPPQRRLAWALGLNPSTTQQAYREAAARHLVSGEVGRGTYVLASSKEATLFRLKQPDRQHQVIDLSTNVPVADPHNLDLKYSLRRLLEQGETALLDHYLGPEQLLLGRIQGTRWLASRGLALRPEEVLLCGGAQQALLLVLQSLCQAGEPVMVEALTAPGIKAACRQLRLPVQGVALDEQGLRPDELDRVVRASGARVLVTTPTLHNPTGACMGEARRQALAEVAKRHDLLVIEDDVYGALTDRPPLYPLLEGRGVLISSMSKTVAAGLRLGWIVARPALLEQIDPYAQATHWSVSPLNLDIACQWISDGTAARRLAWQREELAERWRLARALLGNALPVDGVPSPHVWLATPGEAEALVARCRAQGVEIVPASVFAVGTERVRAVRVSLSAAHSRAQLKQGLELVGAGLTRDCN
ncbi:aminotransferase-like domain-containing protein [Pseudomonas mosselii]|uniref:aminotransferase-like domain-containing protein n=1 Tax=Pseudomonas mosselii TaxID=78327 RepID=UPI0021D7DA37|nr:PLP-dependent aminotransferase family protein [Pseudomonas mosselii]MCU9529809.1 PLP-dependent aminotransferase family protein [Pseudomonas mosselii]MCU9538335.1 PLP-dependent aminotransferase family protein [Pseudomonas mosselii]MCU9543361.1 PLP-dependent aminotransferase family protein [Pseudomonas mosselii]MCU9549201.1 PLP-dependent aminotransferase family protein [Pseudomonas mosselii]